MTRFAFVALAVLLAAHASCSSRTKPSDATPENKTMTSKPTQSAVSCRDRLRALVVAGDLSSGSGLNTPCTRSDAEAVFGAAGEPGQGRLSGFSRSWLRYRLSDDTTARVWLGEHDEILLVDVAHPKIAESPADLRRRLGDPATTIPARHDPTHEEWIFPDRGITLAVGNEGDDTSTVKVSYLFIYAPTTLDDYVKRLGGKDSWVIRRPMRP